jgi:hypothetical protein
MTDSRTVSKVITVIEWGMVVSLVWIMASSMIGVPANNDQHPETYVSFQTGKPAVYRVLVPLLARAAMFLLDLPADHGIAFVIFLAGIAAYWSMRRLFENYQAGRYAPFAFVLTYAMLSNHATPLDFMTVFLFCLAFYLLASRRFDLYYILFPFVVLHRETSVLLILLFALYARRHHTHILGLVYQLFTFGVIRFLLGMTFAGAEGSGNLYYLFLYDVMGVYLQTPAVWITALLLALAGIVIAARWKDYDPFLRCALLLFPVQIILHLLVGNPFEVRVMAESFPIFWLMFATGLQGLFQRSMLAALHHGEERLKQGGIE